MTKKEKELAKFMLQGVMIVTYSLVDELVYLPNEKQICLKSEINGRDYDDSQDYRDAIKSHVEKLTKVMLKVINDGLISYDKVVKAWIAEAPENLENQQDIQILGNQRDN